MNPGLPVTPNRSRRKREHTKHNPGIDMTPMVDLGFLLIAFFVMTTELSKPSVFNLAMPKDGPPMDLARSDAMTVLLGANNRILYYHGNLDEEILKSSVRETDLSASGLRRIIRDKQAVLDHSGRVEGRDGLMLIIKPGTKSNYRNLVKVLDEIIITDVKKYSLVKIGPDEEKFLE